LIAVSVSGAYFSPAMMIRSFARDEIQVLADPVAAVAGVEPAIDEPGRRSASL
jgi:hypothetical protein